MGRQAYLTKIALGRSAFEPSQSNSRTSEYVQLDSTQQDIPIDSSGNKYIQLYDDRGYPINPRAREHARNSIKAQNDVLASVGVLRRRSPFDGLPGSNEARSDLLEQEASAGECIAIASSFAKHLGTWWIGTLRDRIMTFQIDDSLQMSQVIAAERQLSGSNIIYAGLPARFLSMMSSQYLMTLIHFLQPLDRLLLSARATHRTKALLRRWRGVLRTMFRTSLDVLLYPLFYHASLQRLGLAPAKPLLPSWKARIAYAGSSLVSPYSVISSVSAGSPKGYLRAILSSPLVFTCIQHFCERWLHASLYEAVESSIVRPANPDIPDPEEEMHKTRVKAILGLPAKSPRSIRNAIRRVLVAIGWAEPYPHLMESQRRSSRQPLQPTDFRGQTSDGGTWEVADATPLHLPRIRAETQDLSEVARLLNEYGIEVPTNHLDERRSRSPSPSPPSPASSTDPGPSQNNDDPRIRITSRGGLVEMEVRLPPQLVSSHTEIANATVPLPNDLGDAAPSTETEAESRLYHRVTSLSTQPAQLISVICRAHIASWVMFPLKAVSLHLIASHYLSSSGGSMGSRRALGSLASFDGLSWRSVGIQVSRLALCGAIELAIDLGLWGCQYLAVTRLGTRSFGWGTL